MAKKNKTEDHSAPENEAPVEAMTEESEIAGLADFEEALPEDELSEVDADEKIDNLEEALLRSRAELDNALKRSVVDVEKAHKKSL